MRKVHVILIMPKCYQFHFYKLQHEILEAQTKKLTAFANYKFKTKTERACACGSALSITLATANMTFCPPFASSRNLDTESVQFLLP
jgi:hypothetical protein